MKTRMKKLISIKSIPIFALALLIVLGTALAESEGDSVTGSGKVEFKSFVFPLLTLEGPTSLSIEGEKSEGTVTVTVNVEQVEPGEGGVLNYYGVIHKFVFKDGSFTTTGDEVAKPTDQPGLSILDGYMNIDSGTGYFQDADGKLSVHGKMDESGAVPKASFKINGTISR